MTGSKKRIAAVVCAAAVGSLAVASGALADVTGTSGGAYLASASLTGTASGSPVNNVAGPIEAVNAPTPPLATSPTQNSATLLAADVSALQAAGVSVSGGSDSSSTSGATGSTNLGPTGQVQSTSELNSNIGVFTPLLGGNQLTASSISSSCTANDGTANSPGATGSTTIVGGVQTTAFGVNTPLDASPAPNTSIPISIVTMLGPTTATITGTLVLNEQTATTNTAGTASITVNAIHLTETATLSVNGNPPFTSETYDVVLGHSACTVTGSDVNAATTAVQLRSFSARSAKNGVQVSWRAVQEIDVAGYNLYLEVRGHKVRLNKHLIDAKQSGRYSFFDRARRAGARYWLQTVNLDGSRSWHGPARVAGRSAAG